MKEFIRRAITGVLSFIVRVVRFLVLTILVIVAWSLAVALVAVLGYFIEPVRSYAAYVFWEETDFRLPTLVFMGVGMVTAGLGWIIWRLFCVGLKI